MATTLQHIQNAIPTTGSSVTLITKYPGLGYVTIGGQDYYGWHLTDETAADLVDKVTKMQTVSINGFIEKFTKVFNELSVETKNHINDMYPDFVIKVTSWVWANTYMVVLGHVDTRIYYTLEEAFEDGCYEGCMGEDGNIIFTIRRSGRENLPDILNNIEYVTDMLDVGEIEWFHECWKFVFQ